MMTKELRHKYRPRPFGRDMIFDRLPPGGADVLRLCSMVDSLEALIREMQHKLPTDDQNSIERRLWIIDAP